MLKENGCSRINGRCAKINDQGEKGWKKQIQVTQPIGGKAIVSDVNREGYEANVMPFMLEGCKAGFGFMEVMKPRRSQRFG